MRHSAVVKPPLHIKHRADENVALIQNLHRRLRIFDRYATAKDESQTALSDVSAGK